MNGKIFLDQSFVSPSASSLLAAGGIVRLDAKGRSIQQPRFYRGCCYTEDYSGWDGLSYRKSSQIPYEAGL